MSLTRAQILIRELIQLLRPQPSRLEFALRLAVICALTTLVAEIYQTPEAALTTYIAFFLNKENRTVSLIMNIVLLLLITLIIGFIFLVAKVVIDDSLWRVASIATISFGLLFLTSASKLRPIGGIIALIAAYALDVLGTIHLGELGTRELLYAWLFVGIPAGVSMVVNLIMAPSPRQLAERAIAQRLELAASMLREPDDDVRRRFRECLREGVVEVQTWLKLAEREKTSPAKDIDALRQGAGCMFAILSAIDTMDRNSEAQVPDTSRETLAQTLAEMAIILMNGAYPIKIVLPAAPHTSDNPLAAKILAEIEDALVRFTEPSTEASPVRETAEETTGFFESDAFTNPDHVHYALKTTAAAMFCYVLYSLLDWPAIHTCFITCYIVSQSTTAESVEKLTLRIVGCLIGAAAGIAAIVFLIPALTSIGALMAVVFFGAYAAAYVAAGSPRISYVGFQIAFAFFLCVIQGPSPDFDMTIARDRVIGILLGNLVVYVAFTNLWPISVGKRIDPAIASLLRKLGAMMTTIDLSARRALASQAQLALATIETDIGLAQYEPSNVRPPRTWIDARRDAVRDMGELVSPLLLSAAQDPSTSVCISGRLETLASAFAAATEPAAAHAKPRSEWSALPLFGIVDSILRRLERATAQHV